MTSYSNFVQDFPRRCIEILGLCLEHATTNDRDVTLLLSIATAGFVIPFERLRPLSPKHPAGDRENFENAKSEFDKIINNSFLNSKLWDNSEGWEFAEKIEEKDIREKQVDYWARLENRKPLSSEKPVISVLSHLRNALSHGSIFTCPNRINKNEPVQISTLIFLSRCYEKQEVEVCDCGKKRKERVPIDKYNLLAVSPENFRKFLEKWVEFLKSLNLTLPTIQDTISEFAQNEVEKDSILNTE